MTNDDLLFRHRLQLFARAGQVGVSRACRELGYHRSWYYRWKPVVESQGLELLRPRRRRHPSPNFSERKPSRYQATDPSPPTP